MNADGEICALKTMLDVDDRSCRREENYGGRRVLLNTCARWEKKE